MLLSNETFIKYVKENFVGVASSDVEYKRLSKELKKKAEFQWLRKSLSSSRGGIRQGIFAVSSSGVLLEKIDTGWPTYDVEASLENLRKAKNSYDKMKGQERVGEKLTTENRSLVLKDLQPHNDKMKLFVSARHYEFDEMEEFDMRHPLYSKRNSEWLSPTESQSFLPNSLEKGEGTSVATEAFAKLILKNHFQFSCEAWWKEHIKEKSFTATVVESNSDAVTLTFEGSANLEADSKWNQSKLSASILGKAIWSKSEKKFTTFELVNLADVEVEQLRKNMHRGNTKKTQVASFLRLAQSDYEKQILPEGLE